MSNIFQQLAGKASRVINRWWLFLVAGILAVAFGIVLFCNPFDTYIAVSVIFGVVMLISGIISLVVALESRNLFMMRGYNLFGATIDILAGIFLCAFPGVTRILLPVILGIWLMYHSFMVMGLSGDIRTLGAPGSGWLTLAGLLMLVLSIFCIFNYSLGATLIVFLVAGAIVLFGAVLVDIAMELRRMNRYIKDDLPPIDYGD